MKLTLEDIIKNIIKEDVENNAVLDAIHNKYFVRIRYDDGQPSGGVGNPKGSRVIQPMAIGTTKSGNRVVRAFQIDGNSRRGSPNWKFFRLDRIISWKPMPNKHFNAPPNEMYGKYNTVGDKTMGQFFDNAKFADFVSPLNRERNKDNTPKISTKNVHGPISADKQWKKNVYTSQPNSSKYAEYARNIDSTSDEINRFDDNLWSAAERERDAQNKKGPIGNTQSYNNDEYDVDDVDFNENEFYDKKGNRR